jgi:formamidopyrimidine-DNA glycosylase
LLADHGSGRWLEQVEVLDASVLRNASPRDLARAMDGRRLLEPERHGKWLLARTDGPSLLFHFGMSGQLRWASGREGRHPHDRVVLKVDGGEIRFRDQRKLQGVWLVSGSREASSVTGPLGRDALGIPLEQLRKRLGGRRGMIKAALMDQELIAGLGNLLADEILWHARIHPRRQAADLDDEEWERLHRSLTKVLRESVDAGCVPDEPSWLTGVRNQKAPACPRCGAGLEVARAGGRSSYSCPGCQPALRQRPAAKAG